MSTHPHTVRSSSVPLYMQGFHYPPPVDHLGEFGQIDTTSYDPTTGLVDTTPPDFTPLVLLPSGADLNLSPTTFDPTGGLVNTVPTISSNTQDIANMYAGAVAAGTITPAQAASQAAAAVATAAKAVASGSNNPFIFPTTGPAPRVATPAVPGAFSSLFSSQTIIKGIPDILLIGGLALFAFAAMGRR